MARPRAKELPVYTKKRLRKLKDGTTSVVRIEYQYDYITHNYKTLSTKTIGYIPEGSTDINDMIPVENPKRGPKPGTRKKKKPEVKTSAESPAVKGGPEMNGKSVGKDLRRQIVAHLRDFIMEAGKDFAFVGEEYRIRAGKTDFYIDLLFYSRALSCLVAVELKSGPFRPEHMGQLNFYLEALDRDVKKPNENPSAGIILCYSKDDTVVEYALSRSMSPAMVADYTLQLPDKSVLEDKFRELTELALENGEADNEE